MVGRSDCCSQKFGTSFDASKWLSLDICGLVCVNMSAGLHIFALVVTTMDLWTECVAFKAIYAILYLPSTLLALSSLYMAWSSDPGAVPLGARPLPDSSDGSAESICSSLSPNPKSQQPQRGIRRCRKCNDNYKPSRAHHDSVTGRCIVKMDHYCPWIGNAVGALNHKFFVLFIFYTFLAAISCLSMLIFIFMNCDYFADGVPNRPPSSAPTFAPTIHSYYTDNGENNNRLTSSWLHGSEEQGKIARVALQQQQQQQQGWMDVMLSNTNDTRRVCDRTHGGIHVALFIICFIFIIFTSCMLIENYDTIQSNTGKIARMKIKAGFGGAELSPVSENYNEMFGGKTRHMSWHWFLPTPVTFPEGMREQILGYTWKEEWSYGPYREATCAPVTTTANNRNNDNNNTNTNNDVELGQSLTANTTTASTKNNIIQPSPLHLPTETSSSSPLDDVTAEENIPLIQEVLEKSSPLTKRNSSSKNNGLDNNESNIQ